jgi:hypothetical protein
MSPLDQSDQSSTQDTRGKQREPSSAIGFRYSDESASSGVALRCQFCSHQSFRRSSLRSSDFKQILLMRYPVRCLRCGQRQMVSFTVAGISLPPSTRSQKSSFEATPSQRRTEPNGDSGAHQSQEDR